MSEKVSKPKQFWISEKCSHGNYFHTVDFEDNGWENAIHVIELAPMLKMLDEMARIVALELPPDKGDKYYEEYKAFKRENGLE